MDRCHQYLDIIRLLPHLLAIGLLVGEPLAQVRGPSLPLLGHSGHISLNNDLGIRVLGLLRLLLLLWGLLLILVLIGVHIWQLVVRVEVLVAEVDGRVISHLGLNEVRSVDVDLWLMEDVVLGLALIALHSVLDWDVNGEPTGALDLLATTHETFVLTELVDELVLSLCNLDKIMGVLKHEHAVIVP